MAKNWLDMVTELSAEVKVLRAGAPDVMKEFSAMARGASPSKKSVRRIKTKVSQLLTPSNKGAWTEGLGTGSAR